MLSLTLQMALARQHIFLGFCLAAVLITTTSILPHPWAHDLFIWACCSKRKCHCFLLSRPPQSLQSAWRVVIFPPGIGMACRIQGQERVVLSGWSQGLRIWAWRAKNGLVPAIGDLDHEAKKIRAQMRLLRHPNAQGLHPWLGNINNCACFFMAQKPSQRSWIPSLWAG